MKLSGDEIQYLAQSFKDFTNLDADDPLEPINPLTFREPEGDNCLHIAAYRGDYKAVALLLKAGFDINEKGDMGYTALHYAYKRKHHDIVNLLKEKGASNEIRNEFGKKPSES